MKDVLFMLQKVFSNLNLATKCFKSPVLNQFRIMPFYAVAKGKTPGIFMTWSDCEAQVKGFSGARYKKFDSVLQAQEFINSEGQLSNSKVKKVSSISQNTSSSNLKRNYSTTSHNLQKVDNIVEPPKKSKKAKKTSVVNSDSSDESDDLETVLHKQLDDIESRLKGCQEGINNIIKKGSKTSKRKTILIEPPKPTESRQEHGDFETDGDGFVQVYTDGACSANGRSGAKAGFGVFWADGHVLNTSEPVSGRATNNCGEIQAAIHAIKLASQNGIKKLAINTDSKFLINAVTKWMPGWKRKGWKLQSGEPVKNEVDFKELDNLKDKLQIKWNYVEAHQGIYGNEMADQLAKAGAILYKM